MSTTKAKSIWDPAIVRTAILDSVRKLHPRTMAKNPVMFVVEVGSVLTTVALLRDGAMIEPQLDACFRQPHAKIPQRLGEFLLARNPAREIELAADLTGGLEQRHIVVEHLVEQDDELHEVGVRLLPERLLAFPEDVVQQ